MEPTRDTESSNDVPATDYRPAWPASVKEAMADRAVGAVIGSAVGDALGAAYENTYPGPDDEIAMLPGRGYYPGRRLGEWTDDTAMALGVLDVLAAGSRSTTAMAANFLAWQGAGPPDIGGQTWAVLNSADGPEGARAAAEDYLRRNPEAAGNGALMRTAPVALGALGERFEVARLATEIASLTHSHPDSVDACVLWSLAIEDAIIGAHYDEPIDVREAICSGLGFVDTDARSDRWAKLIEVALTTENAAEARRRFTPNGWVVTAFQAALWAIAHTPVPAERPADHFRHALINSIRVGHDTDTVAAIAGGLLGACWGAAAIPEEWKRILHGDRVRGETVSGEELATLARRAFDAVCVGDQGPPRRIPNSVGFPAGMNVGEAAIRSARAWAQWAEADCDWQILVDAGIIAGIEDDEDEDDDE